MKICLQCGKEIEFTAKAKKYCSEVCRKRVKYEKDRAWLLAHPGKSVEYAKNWREKNPEKVLQAGRDSYRRKCLKNIEEDRQNG